MYSSLSCLPSLASLNRVISGKMNEPPETTTRQRSYRYHRASYINPKPCYLMMNASLTSRDGPVDSSAEHCHTHHRPDQRQRRPAQRLRGTLVRTSLAPDGGDSKNTAPCRIQCYRSRDPSARRPGCETAPCHGRGRRRARFLAREAGESP